MKCRFVAATAALLLLAGHALAGTSTSTLAVTLHATDLNPSDGVDPAAFVMTSQTYLSIFEDDCCSGPPAMLGGFLGLTPFDYTGPHTDTNVQTVTNGVSASAWDLGHATITVGGWADYVVSPYTSVSITFDIGLSATPGEAWAGADTCFQSDLACQHARSAIDPYARTVTYTYVNDTADYGSFFVEADMFAQASGIPEPSTVVLMAIGAGMLIRRARPA